VKRLGIVLALAICSSVASADSIEVNFDTLAPGQYAAGVPIVLFSNADFDILMIRDGDGSPFSFEIVSTLPGMPPDWGTQVLSPFNDSDNPNPFSVLIVAKGASVVGSFSFQVGDFSGSDTDLYTISTVRVGADPIPLPGDVNTSSGVLDGMSPDPFTSTTQTVSMTNGIQIFNFGGGSGGPNAQSLYWDRFIFETMSLADAALLSDVPQGDFSDGASGSSPGTSGQFASTSSNPVPEPGSVSLLGVGILALWWRRRTRKPA